MLLTSQREFGFLLRALPGLSIRRPKKGLITHSPTSTPSVLSRSIQRLLSTFSNTWKCKGETVHRILMSSPSASLPPCNSPPPGPHDCLAYWLFSLLLANHYLSALTLALVHIDVGQAFMEIHQLTSHSTVQCASSGDIYKQKRNYNFIEIINIKRNYYNRWMGHPHSRIYALVKWKDSVSVIQFPWICVWFSCIHTLENNTNNIQHGKLFRWRKGKRNLTLQYLCSCHGKLPANERCLWSLPLWYIPLDDRDRERTLGPLWNLFAKAGWDLERWRTERGQKARAQHRCWGAQKGRLNPFSPLLCSFSSAAKIIPKVCFLAINKETRPCVMEGTFHPRTLRAEAEELPSLQDKFQASQQKHIRPHPKATNIEKAL